MNTATVKNTFSMERTIRLCKRYFAIKKRMVLIGGAIIIGLLAIIYIPIVINAPESFKTTGPLNLMTIAFTLFSWAGYALTSTMFDEMNSAGSATHYLTLPVSSSEKLFSAWLVSYVCYSVIGMFALLVLSLIVDADMSFIFSIDTLNKFLVYTIFQFVFLYGAVLFKANNFLTTVVAILAFSFVMMLILLSLHYSGFDSEGWSLSKLVHIEKSDSIGAVIKNVVLTLIVATIFTWASLKRLKNREIV